TRSLTGARSSHPLAPLGLAPTPSTRPPPSRHSPHLPALPALPYTPPPPRFGLLCLALLLVLCVCVHG
ncbi:hypothetical protein C0993_001004, partial [Termitomyces sp. T159_Od127]